MGNSSSTGVTHAIQRRGSSQYMPQELEDLEDCTVVQGCDENLEDDDEDTLSGGSLVQQLSETGDEADNFKENIMKLPKEVRNIVAGGFAGMLAKSVVAPIDRVKILYQVSCAKFHLRNVPKVMKNIIRDEGFAALWKGNAATMIRVFPYSGIQFMVFDRCKIHFLHQHEHHRYIRGFPGSNHANVTGSSASSSAPSSRRRFGLTPLESLISGMVAGTVSVMLTYPLDLTRAQLAVLRRHRHAANRGFVSVLTDNYTQRGPLGLFRGVVPTLIGILPYSGIAFALNEQAKREVQHMTQRDLTTIERMQCGAFSGLIAQSITYPIEVTRRRMQTIGLVGHDTALGSVGADGKNATETLPSLVGTIRSLYAEQGLRGFFKGVSMNWMKGPIAFSISFTAFDTLQSLMESDKERLIRLPRTMSFKRDN